MKFSIYFSLDKENIILVEKNDVTDTNALVIILDAYNLNVINEMIISVRDPEYVISGYPESSDDNAGDMTTHFPTKAHMQPVFWWNRGK